MLHILSAAFVFALIYRLAGYFQKPETEAGPQEMVQDAFTGIYFPKNSAVKVVRGGETLHFQNLENRDLFLSSRK